MASRRWLRRSACCGARLEQRWKAGPGSGPPGCWTTFNGQCASHGMVPQWDGARHCSSGAVEPKRHPFWCLSCTLGRCTCPMDCRILHHRATRLLDTVAARHSGWEWSNPGKRCGRCVWLCLSFTRRLVPCRKHNGVRSSTGAVGPAL